MLTCIFLDVLLAEWLRHIECASGVIRVLCSGCVNCCIAFLVFKRVFPVFSCSLLVAWVSGSTVTWLSSEKIWIKLISLRSILVQTMDRNGTKTKRISENPD